MISERLTLVAVVLLTLTVSTGFFGMNFGWLTTHRSATAFVLFGIVVPVGLVATTLFGARYLTQNDVRQLPLRTRHQPRRRRAGWGAQQRDLPGNNQRASAAAYFSVA